MCIPSHDFFPTNKDATIFRALARGKKLYKEEIGCGPLLSEESGQNHNAKHGSDDNEDEMLIYEILAA